jgi:hypothetical protein
MERMTQLRSDKGYIYIALDNGLTVSIQYGKGYYSSNYDYTGELKDLPPTETVEVGILRGGDLIEFNGNCVAAYIPVMQAIHLITLVAAFPENLTQDQMAAITESIALLEPKT